MAQIDFRHLARKAAIKVRTELLPTVRQVYGQALTPGCNGNAKLWTVRPLRLAFAVAPQRLGR